ncbi:PfkB family carbohydrate kinase [Cellulomonas cellasea]|uniref:Sugar/nucleoside kinase (Ribokinase family) n=1 Tax=Cellulomonas cellasea TaxID=43670 RepID=A0A7W4YAR8_9CELL|nr:PfkB family carbohydrate kinase [Cellulomonas cellasea]MBB2923065.1 sugar/nucleoside kinase (ribokinase family) [Cellulomonas cellasea]
MTSPPPLVVACGLVTLDVLQDVDHVPAPDEKLVASRLDVTFGGPAANAAATAVALGVRARLVTALGSGPVAGLVRAGLDEAGVEVVDLLDGAPASPAVSTVLVTRGTGERAVVSVNASASGDLAGAARDRAGAVLDGADVLLLDGHHLGAALVLAEAARARGVPVVLDGGSWKPRTDELLAHVDHAVLSADFHLPEDLRGAARDLRGDAPDDEEPRAVPSAGEVLGDAPSAEQDLAAVALLGPAFVARSAGPGPVRFRLRVAGAPDPEVGTVEPPVVPRGDVVDTLGAGDVLHGAFAEQLARGVDPVTALTAATRVASLSVRARGARGWVAGAAAPTV